MARPISLSGKIMENPINTNELALGPDETLDILEEKGLKLIQPRLGYRFSVDAMLLAEFAQPVSKGKVLDLGCGCGVVGLLLAQKPQITQVTGLELQPELADLAQRNVQLNGFEHKVKIIKGDLRQIENTFGRWEFDALVTNPPYWQAYSGRLNPRPDKAQARHELTFTLEDLAQAAAYLVRPRGKICLIYPVARLAEVIGIFQRHRLEPKLLQLIHPNPASEATMFLMCASPQVRPGLRLLPPLFVPGSNSK